MYDELIKQLRETSVDFGESDDVSVMMIEAANAIEELQKITTHYEEESKGWWLAACDAKEERERLKEQLRKEKVDNVNLTGWLAEEHAKHLWIPVTERLPDVFKHVLVNIPGMAPHPTVQEAFREKNEMWYSNGFRYELDDVSHWMPLPQPPKDGES